MAELSLQQLQTQVNGKANISHGNHVPAVQTANNAVYLRNDNTWQTLVPSEIGAASASHTHTKANITDFPTSLPANGGNADTIDGYHASSLMGGFDEGHLFAETGYQKFSNGLIIQWGNVSRATWTNLPIAFPHACFSVVGVLGGAGSSASAGCQAEATTTQVWVSYGGSTSTLHHYIAIGY